MTNEVTKFWKKFCENHGLPSSEHYYEAFHFETTKESANALLDLVLKGQKKATASSYLYYKATKEPLPTIGSYSIVTDFDGIPRCVIQTTDIQIIPFKDLTFDIVKREGEDTTLESWQEKHIRFYMEDGRTNGYTFSPEMKVVFEDFKVVYREDFL